MILSVSRRTDIPNYYPEWFMNRIREGYLCVRNPMNPRQVSRINISPDVVDCIVFWTKNPQPMWSYLSGLEGYEYYVQFTLNGYGRDIEPGVPELGKRMDTFLRFSELLGPERMVWRYDPILFTEEYTPEYHIRRFEIIARALRGYTNRCIISFVDEYAKIRQALWKLGHYELSREELTVFAKTLAETARENGMTMATCAEKLNLEACGISHSACIDKGLIEELLDCKLDGRKDANQRAECGCMESIDVGTYNTCKNGCRYCYANYSANSVLENNRKYDPASPILCGQLREEDKLTERKVKSLKLPEDGQMTMEFF